MGQQTNIPIDVLRDLVARVQDCGAVDYSHRDGVQCPVCGSRLRNQRGIIRTMPWIGRARERYHKCPVCGKRFKSIESA